MTKTKTRNSLLFNDLEFRFRERPEYLEFIKSPLDARFDHYGNHFKQHFDSSKFFSCAQLVYILIVIYSFILSYTKKDKIVDILSTAYFNTDSILKSVYGYRVSRPPWALNLKYSNIFDVKLVKAAYEIINTFEKGNLEYITSDFFISKIVNFELAFEKYLLNHGIKALIVPQDIGFFEKLAIRLCAKLNIPSFAFVHGLQFHLNDIDFNRTDYLVVWGELSKNDFVSKGFSKDKIFVSGHPNFADLNVIKSKLEFDFKNIVVLTLSLPGISPSDVRNITNRSNCIFYLSVIKRVLINMGVHRVKIRPHPSENTQWYKLNIDTTFFIFDERPLNLVLKDASLVIGPTSTVLFDSLIAGVNYLVFEYEENGMSLNGYPIPSVYNGSNSKVPVAKNEPELIDILCKRKAIDVSVIHDLCAKSFNIDFIQPLLLNSIN